MRKNKTASNPDRAMENPSYIVLSQQMGLQRNMDVIANNLANMNTTGYRSERLMFSEFMTSKATNPGVTGDGARLSFPGVAGTLADIGEGTLETTGNQLDFAIKGSGFFVVDTPNGPRYTRDGRFELDGQGRIVNKEGYPILDAQNRPLTVPPGTAKVEATPTGTLSTERGPIGSLQVVKFDSEIGLKKAGTNLFETDQAPQKADSFTLQQNAVEASNVKPIIEMTKMIAVQRAYQSAQQMLDQERERSSRAIATFTKTN
jgi:flagellar basal-body rod protein FlgF